MSFSITLTPSGHHFEAQPGESLLEAALRAGLNLSYHCNSGSCGECKVRVVTGQVSIIRHADYALSAAERLQSHVLLCAVAAQSDVTIQADEAVKAIDIPLQQIEVKPSRCNHLANGYYELNVRTPRSKTLRFLAGQSVRMICGQAVSRPLSIASCPCNGMNLQFHLHQQETDPVLRAIIEERVPGGLWRLQGPFGDFTLDDASRRSSVFVAYDTGFAAIKSLVEHALALEKEQSMYLFWLMPDGDPYQANYCRAWEDVFDGFVYIPLQMNASRPGQSEFTEAAQRILSRSPAENAIDLYLAGPQLMLDSVSAAFKARGTPPERIFCKVE